MSSLCVKLARIKILGLFEVLPLIVEVMVIQHNSHCAMR